MNPRKKQRHPAAAATRCGLFLGGLALLLPACGGSSGGAGVGPTPTSSLTWGQGKWGETQWGTSQASALRHRAPNQSETITTDQITPVQETQR